VTDALVQLTAAGCTVLVDVSGLPEIVHWGAALPELGEQAARALAADRPPRSDPPVRLAVLPEPHTGYLGRPGIEGSRGGVGWSTRFAVRSVTLDGRPVGGYVSGGAGAIEVRADGDGLTLAVTVELLPSGLLRCRAEIGNTGTDSYELGALTIALPVPARAAELLDFAGRWGKERVPQRIPFNVGQWLRESRQGRPGHDGAYVLHAGVPGFGFAGGEVWGVHLAWSGNQSLMAERTFDGFRVLGGGELLLPGEVRLAGGESYTGPWLYGSYGAGLDESARRFHRHLRAREGHPSTDRPITLNVWEAVYFDHDVDTLRRLADVAAEVGVERYVLDDGWFGGRRDDHRGLGDWYVAPEVWPDGLHPLVEHVTALGMQFGLWVEPEMVNADSDLARAHPEWIMAARDEWPVESRHQQVLDLAIPECYEHILGRLDALLGEYAIAYLKWDHNRELVEAGNQLDRGRPAVHAQTLATYRMLATLRERHPGLEIESCSSGGGRVDLGILELTDRIWVSDCIDPLERQHMLRWTGQLLPPELLGSHIASARSHTTGRRHDLDFRAATAFFGHFGIEWNLLDTTAAERARLRTWLALYKRHRRLLNTGDLVRMDHTDPDRYVHAVVAGDRSQALIAYVHLGYPVENPGPKVCVRGLDPDRTYVLTAFTDAPEITITGAALEHIGVRLPLRNPEQAIVLYATARDAG
jgi:alpha-galactosidase